MLGVRLLSIILALITLSAGQTIIPTASSAEFPGCALSCAVLLQAQQSCIPPVAAQTSQLTYDNCFCQFSTVQAIYATPDSVCAAECTLEADRQLLRSWFTGFCAQVGQGVDPVAATATTNPTATATNQQPTTVITLSGSPSPGSSDNQVPGWFSTHWKWVIMLIVLFFAFLFIAIFAVCLKRRYKRKHHEETARMSGFPMTQEGGVMKSRGATPDLWGPHQHMEATQGYQYSRAAGVPRGGALGSARRHSSHRESTSDAEEKRKYGKAIDVNEITEVKEDSKPRPKRSKSSRARPEELDVDLRAAEVERSRSDRGRLRDKNRAKEKAVAQELQGMPGGITQHSNRDER